MYMDANYYKFKTKKDSLSVQHNKLQRKYRNMDYIILKQQKELEELKENIGKYTI